jgi:hypothetical protein
LTPVDAFWHLLNFVAPAAGLGLMTASFAKLLWRRELQPVSWLRLSAWAASGSTAALIAGLVIFGHDGKMATYAAMIACCSLALWWAGFGSRRR